MARQSACDFEGCGFERNPAHVIHPAGEPLAVNAVSRIPQSEADAVLARSGDPKRGPNGVVNGHRLAIDGERPEVPEVAGKVDARLFSEPKIKQPRPLDGGF